MQGASTAIAIGGPILAGIAEQAFFGNRERADLTANERMTQSGLSTGLTALSTGAAVGSAFGPIGTAVGAAVGGLVGFTSALNAAELSAEELSQVNQKLQEQNQKNITAAGSYVDAQNKLNELIRSGASDTEIEAASENLRKSFNEIADTKLQDAFSAAGGDVSVLTEKMKEFTQSYGRSQALAGLGTLITDKGGFFGGGETIKTQLNQADTNQIGQLLLSSGIDLKQLEDIAYEGQKRSTELSNLIGKRIEINEGTESARAGREERGFDDYELRSLRARGIISSESPNELFKGLQGFEKDFQREIEDILSKGGLEEGTDTFKASYDFLVKFLFSDKGLGFIENITQDQDAFDLRREAAKFQATASRTFNNIFRGVEDQFTTLSSRTLRLIENQSTNQKIDSAILDFTSTLNDQLASFIKGNLPNLEGYQFAQAAAQQKANDQLAKVTQDYQIFEQNQVTARRQALENNAKELSKAFKENLFPSQEVGELFENEILPELKKGNYNVDFAGAANRAREESLRAYNEKYFTSKGINRNVTIDGLDAAIKNLEEDVKNFATLDSNDASSVEERRSDAAEQLADLLNIQKQITLTASQGDEEKLKSLLLEKAEAQKTFDLKQKNAKREQEINKQLTEQKIEAEKTLAVEKAKIDAQNLARTRAAEITSSRLGFARDIASARGEAGISRIQRGLNDPRQTFGMGLQEITERRIAAERDILEQRRAIEDNQLQIEMQQSMLRLNAEIENTNALKDLNSAVLDLIGVQLSADKDVQRISETIAAGGEFSNLEDLKSSDPQAFAKYESLQRIRQIQASSGSSSSELRNALSKNSDLNFESLKNTAKGNEELLEQIKLLEEQYETRKEILGIQRQATDEDIAQQAELERINNTLGGRFQKGIGGMRAESDAILLNLAETAPSRFADGMANALSEVAQGTKSIGDAFADMAIDFGRMLQQEVFRALAQKAVGSLLGNFASGIGSQTGGVIRAQNGMYISGGRTGDRNLALLEDGEYVLNRNAVKSMGGPRALDRLNFGMAPRFQGGGGYSMEAARSLKNGEYDYTGDLMFNGANIGAINPDLYSAYAFENDAYFQRRRELARERFQRQVQKRFERRQKRAQLVGAIIGAAGSMFMSAGLGKMFTPTSTTTGGAFGAGQTTSSFKGLYSKGLNPFKRITSDHLPASLATPLNTVQKGGLIGYNSGGFVPHGSRLSDTIPAMLTGGEYVMNNSAVKKYGLGTMNSMNAGSYQSGGMASTTNNTNNNSTSISINVDRSGKAVYGASTNSYDKDDIVLSKEMARQINNLVLKSMVNEKRYGGELYKNPLRT